MSVALPATRRRDPADQNEKPRRTTTTTASANCRLCTLLCQTCMALPNRKGPPMSAANASTFISLREAGQRVGLSYWSIRARVRDGLLPAYRTSATSALRVKISDVDALLTRVVPRSTERQANRP